jgi:hypothetical protein
MKVDQKVIVRWISKRQAKRGASAVPKAAVQELDAALLRQVSGGTGSTQLPRTGW